MSKTTKSSSNTKTTHNYDDLSDEVTNSSSNEDDVSLPRSIKSKKLQQPIDAADYDDNMFDRGSRRKRKRGGKSGKKKKGGKKSRSRSRRRR